MKKITIKGDKDKKYNFDNGISEGGTVIEISEEEYEKINNKDLSTKDVIEWIKNKFNNVT